MSTSTEQQLRELFATEAAAAPHAMGLAEGARRRVRRRRSAQGGWVAGGVAAVIAVGVFGVGMPDRDVPDPPSVAAPGPALQGPLKGGPLNSCVREFTPAMLPKMKGGFAFDGTVATISATYRRPKEPLPEVAVTLRVNEWFRGTGGDTAVVAMFPPAVYVSSSTVPSYQVGTRLLVSGSTRSGEVTHERRAWHCGYTRYYDPSTAAAWAAVTK